MSLPCPSHSTHVANPNFGTRYRYLNRIQIPLCTTLFLGSHFETRTCLNSSLSNAPYFETRTRYVSQIFPIQFSLYTTLFLRSNFETRTCLKYFPFSYNTPPGVTFRLDNRIYQSRWIANMYNVYSVYRKYLLRKKLGAVVDNL